MNENFGDLLRRFRLRAGLGLRKFAEMVELKPSNLSAIEHNRRAAPSEKLEEMAEVLGLSQGTDDWALFFDAARPEGGLPRDIAHVANRRLVPVLLRTIDNQQLSDEEIAKLIADLESQTEGAANDSERASDVFSTTPGEQGGEVSP